MFDFLFGSKKPTLKIIDFIWKTKEEKYRAIANKMFSGEAIILACFFDDTKNELIQIANVLQVPASASLSSYEKILLLSADSLMHTNTSLKHQIIFVEHYPSFDIENETLLNINEIFKHDRYTFFMSLDEPLFQYFGADRMVAILERMGFQENESISHKMLTESIKKVQQKVDKEAKSMQDTQNAKEWFALNLRSEK